MECIIVIARANVINVDFTLNPVKVIFVLAAIIRDRNIRGIAFSHTSRCYIIEIINIIGSTIILDLDCVIRTRICMIKGIFISTILIGNIDFCVSA